MTDAKLIFSLVDNAETMLAASLINKVSFPVVAVKVDKRQSLPDHVIDLGDLIKPTGKIVIMLH